MNTEVWSIPFGYFRPRYCIVRIHFVGLGKNDFILIWSWWLWLILLMEADGWKEGLGSTHTQHKTIVLISNLNEEGKFLNCSTLLCSHLETALHEKRGFHRSMNVHIHSLHDDDSKQTKFKSVWWCNWNRIVDYINRIKWLGIDEFQKERWSSLATEIREKLEIGKRYYTILCFLSSSISCCCKILLNHEHHISGTIS